MVFVRSGGGGGGSGVCGDGGGGDGGDGGIVNDDCSDDNGIGVKIDPVFLRL